MTLAGVEWLFDKGAEIVILACNTASANALRKIQQEILPTKYPNKKVLGIIIPTVEEIEKYSKSGHIGILATKATVESRIYEIEMEKQNPQIKIISQAGGDLAKLIEHNDEAGLAGEIKRVAGALLAKDDMIDAIVLGCTHYALVENEISQILPKHIRFIGQGKLIAAKLSDYLGRHLEISSRLCNASSVDFYTTSNNEQVKDLMKYFYGKNIIVSTVVF